MKRYGFVDIGSNTVRIVIYKLKKHIDYKLLVNEKESVRLRNFVTDDLILTEDGINKLLEVLKRYIKIAKEHRVEFLYLFATQTIRMVTNRDEIVSRVNNNLDYPIHVLSKEEEALIGFEGMSRYLPHQEDGLYVDLGGGSTEVVHFVEDEPVDVHSFDFGSIVLRNMVEHAVPTTSEINKLKKYLYDQFVQLPWLKQLEVPLIVVGGSSRNMVRIDRFITKRNEPTHGYTLHFREVKRTRKLLMLLTLDEIEKIEGFTSSRADIIIPSIFVFETLYEYIQAPYYVCSRRGLREGMLLKVTGR